MLTRETDLSIYPAAPRNVDSISYIWILDRNSGDVELALQQYVDAIGEQSLPGRLIVVNNGLGDRVSHQISERLRDSSVESTLVNFNVRSSESSVLTIALKLKETSGDIVVLLPSYPQSDPRDVSRMLDAVHDGLDYVASWRTPRVDSKKEQGRSRLFNAITRWLSGIDIHDINSGLRVMRREVVADLPLYGDLHIYLPILAARQGFRIGEVPVRHLEERTNTQGPVAGVYLRRALDLFTLFFLMRFTQKPFRFFGGIGAGLLTTGGLINLSLAAQKIFLARTLADKPMLVLATLLMVLGIQMFSLGLIGELIIFVAAGGVKDYQIEHVYETPRESVNREA